MFPSQFLGSSDRSDPFVDQKIIKQNFLKAAVFYEALSYELVSEVPVYNVSTCQWMYNSSHSLRWKMNDRFSYRKNNTYSPNMFQNNFSWFRSTLFIDCCFLPLSWVMTKFMGQNLARIPLQFWKSLPCGFDEIFKLTKYWKLLQDYASCEMRLVSIVVILLIMVIISLAGCNVLKWFGNITLHFVILCLFSKSGQITNIIIVRIRKQQKLITDVYVVPHQYDSYD